MDVEIQTKNPRAREMARRVRQMERKLAFGPCRQRRKSREIALYRYVKAWIDHQDTTQIDLSDLPFLGVKPGRVCDFACNRSKGS